MANGIRSMNPEDAKSAARLQFGRQAEAYARSRTPAAGDALTRMIELATATPTDEVLDIATGGATSRPLSHRTWDESSPRI